MSTDPNTIPNGYDAEAHRKLEGTIAPPARLCPLQPLRIMGCHESPRGKEIPCVGWLAHQLGSGNNLALRLAAITGQVDANVETVGPQHKTFEDTLP